jgi:hypothetical protein
MWCVRGGGSRRGEERLETAPHDAWRPEATAWESPWKQHTYGTLFVFVLGLVAAFVYIVVLKLDWVGV